MFVNNNVDKVHMKMRIIIQNTGIYSCTHSLPGPRIQSVGAGTDGADDVFRLQYNPFPFPVNLTYSCITVVYSI